MSRMEPFGKLIDANNRAGASFVFIELETARTFLQTAATSQIDENRVRNRENAHLAYTTALQYAPEVLLSREQREQFEKLVAELRVLLLEAGVAL